MVFALKPVEADGTPGADVLESARSILDDNRLCAISTVDGDGQPHICTVWFAVGKGLDLVVFTNPDTRHARNLAGDPRAAVTIADSHQEWGGPLRGIQLTGTMSQAQGVSAVTAFSTYARKFTGITRIAKAYRDVEIARDSRLFVFTPRRITVIDEARFGHKVRISALVE